MLMVSMFYGRDENQGQVETQHGTDWSAVTNTNTNTLPHGLPPFSHPPASPEDRPGLDLSHSQSRSNSHSSATSGGQIIEEIKVILMRSKLLTFLALCQDTQLRPT